MKKKLLALSLAFSMFMQGVSVSAVPENYDLFGNTIEESCEIDIEDTAEDVAVMAEDAEEEEIVIESIADVEEGFIADENLQSEEISDAVQNGSDVQTGSEEYTGLEDCELFSAGEFVEDSIEEDQSIVENAGTETEMVIKTGSAGVGVRYEIRFSSQNGYTLEFTGSGDMTDWNYSQDPPYIDYEDDIQHVIVGEGITSLGDYAFYFFSSIESVKLPSTLVEIGKYAFYYNKKLLSIELPKGLKTIGAKAFGSCDELHTVEFSDSLTTIGDSAFYNCDELRTVKLPNNISTIGESALYDVDTVYAFAGTLTANTLDAENIKWTDFRCKDGHSYDYSQNVIPATFDTKGYIKAPCQMCGVWKDSAIEIPVIKIEHTGYYKYERLSNNEYMYLYQFNGLPREPKVTVTAGKNPVESQYYTVEYLNNVNVGDAEVKVTMNGLYSGTYTEQFKIDPASVSVDVDYSSCIRSYYWDEYISYDVEKAVTAVYPYTGLPYEPEVIVRSSGKDLDPSYYTVEYLNNINTGIATVQVTFGGETAGCYTEQFAIVPKAVPLKSLTSLAGGFKASWTPTKDNLSGYEVSYDQGYGYDEKIKKVSGTASSVTLTNLKAKETYSVKIRPYKTIGSMKFYGDWSPEKEVETKKNLAKTISLRKKLTVVKGISQKITPSYDSRTKYLGKIQWSSSNKNIATVNSKGVITGKKTGTCKIRCKYNGKTYTCTLTVKENKFVGKKIGAIDPWDYRYGEVHLFESEMSYKNGGLSLTTVAANSRYYRADKFSYITITVYDGNYKQIAKQKFRNVRIDLPAFGKKYMTFNFSKNNVKNKKADLRKAYITYDYYYYYSY